MRKIKLLWLVVVLLIGLGSPVFGSNGTPLETIQQELALGETQIETPAPGVTIIVKKGDSYSHLASRFCGIKNLSKLIKANGKTFEEANLIFPGEAVFIPLGLLKDGFKDPLRKIEKEIKIRGEIETLLQKEKQKSNELEKTLGIAEKERASLKDKIAKLGRWIGYLQIGLAAISLLSIAFLFFYVSEKRRYKAEIKHLKAGFERHTLGAEKLKQSLQESRMRIELSSGEKFTFPERMDRSGHYIIRPFYLKTSKGEEDVIREKDRARDVIKSFIKRALNGEEAPEVYEALKNYDLVQLKSGSGKFINY
jgi:hypothetical protein